MITCPWCGTNYAAFQSNCKNCGGPLNPPPKPQTEPQPVEELLAPPPVPRPIPNSYIWKLMLPDAWSITAFIFAFIGIIFLCLGVSLTIGIVSAFVGIPFALIGLVMGGGGIGVLVWRYQVLSTLVRVLQVGEAVRGQIVDVEQNHSVEINGRHPWKITYRFVSPRGKAEGRVTTLNVPGPQLQPGREVYVLYLPNAPENNTIYPHP